MHEPSWIDSFIRYITEGILPSNLEEARLLKQRVSQFILPDGQLYRKSSYVLLKFLRLIEADYILQESMKASAGTTWRVGP